MSSIQVASTTNRSKLLSNRFAFRAFVTFICILSLPTLQAAAQSRHAAVSVDGNTGRTLQAESADEPRYPASLTKMMTLYLAFEQIEAGKLSYATRIKISQEAARAAPSKLDLEPGEYITMIDAIKALVTKSANDIAVAIAEHIGGSESEFAKRMTAKARQLGMSNTTFRNAHGLPDVGQVTTARDMVTLAIRLHDDFPRHYGLFATRVFSYNGSTFRNHNTLLGSYEGMEGLKTGYTRMSGFNLVSSVKRGDRHVFAAVFGGETAGARNATMRNLLNRTILMASATKSRKPAPTAAMLVATARPVIRHPAKPVVMAAASATAPLPRPTQVPAMTTTPARITETAVKPPLALPPQIAVETAEMPGLAPQIGEPQPTHQPAFSTSEPLPPAAPTHRLEIAQVRRVMVAPRAKPDTATEAATQSEPNATPRLEAFAQPPLTMRPASYAAEDRPQLPSAQQVAVRTAEAIAAPTANTTVVPKTRAAPALAAAAEILPKPPGRPAEVARPGAAVSPGQIIAAPPAPPVTAILPARGAPPSTLQAQASALGQPTFREPARQIAALSSPSSLPTRSRLNGPSVEVTNPIDPKAGGFQLQVGAYATQVDADRALGQLRARTGALLAGNAALTLPVQKDNRQLFRARFSGFSAQGAATTCLELRRQQIDCFVMKAE